MSKLQIDNLQIRPATPEDADQVAEIYNHYIANSVITFEVDAISGEEMALRIEEVRASKFPWLVAELDGVVAGYAYAVPWKARSAYRFTAEITIYLAPEFGGRGIGSALYGELLSELRTKEIHAVIGGIALPNEASVALHEKLGFEKVAHFKQTGFKFDRWIDVGYWQRIL